MKIFFLLQEHTTLECLLDNPTSNKALVSWAYDIIQCKHDKLSEGPATQVIFWSFPPGKIGYAKPLTVCICSICFFIIMQRTS